MLSKTLILSVLAIANVVSADTCSAGTQTVNGRQCTTTCNSDRPGGDYASMQTSTYIGCIEACASQSLCVSATYNENSGFCYLKRSLNSAQYSYGNDLVDCSAAPSSTAAPAPQCTPGPVTIGDTQCTVSCNTDRAGGDFAQQQTGTFEGCIQACASNNLCVSAQYNEATLFCYLKRARNAAVSSSGIDTVDCTPPTYGCGNPFTCGASQQATNYDCGSQNQCFCFGFASQSGVCFPNSSCNYPSCKTTQDCASGNTCVGGCCGGICLPTSMAGTCSSTSSPSRLFARDVYGRGAANNAGISS